MCERFGKEECVIYVNGMLPMLKQRKHKNTHRAQPVDSGKMIKMIKEPLDLVQVLSAMGSNFVKKKRHRELKKLQFAGKNV